MQPRNSMEEVRERFEVKHEGYKYDIDDFLRNHPGGVNYVQGYREKEVTRRMLDTKHSQSAFYLLREYKIGGRNEQTTEFNEDLEKLVDWNKPMLSQVGSLGSKYNEWVTSPVDRQLRLFGNPILENLTITPWYVVPIIWIPIIVYLIHYGSKKYVQITNDSAPTIPTILTISSGIILWSLIEYSLHRWVFHMEPSGSSKTLIYLHFAIHGLHHKVPFDSRRLVFPPLPAAILAYAGYKLFSFIVPDCFMILVLAGALTGYVIYDMIHFYLHYGAPKEGTYFYNMKRYHNQHHFSHHDSGFGISSLYWDKIFGTAIKLRSLAVGIKW